ncbi:reticulophagy regulator 3-like [Schistocerca cancellata]|uniref:reticulophagy regulator 3-like n=1 Tax=Schistocerca cancellata TaxID=274614 RepID=UPI00211987C7|nr:reticulophagy regulator 3-like [Schistocerca cancellata]
MDLRKRVTDWFSRMRSWKTGTGTQAEASVAVVDDDPDLERTLWRFEPYVMKVQSVLIWENPVISVFCVVVVNILFWLVVNFQWRFYGLLFTLALTAILYDVWAQKCWPEISESLSEKTRRTLQVPPMQTRALTVPEISHYLSQAQSMLRDYYIWLKNMRDDQPGMFCCLMCASFLVLTVIGRTVPGCVIGYILIMTVMVGPGVCIHVLPPTAVQKLKNFCVSFKEKGRDTDSEVEDYLPEQTGENLALLQQAGEPVEDEQQDDSVIPEEFGLELEMSGNDPTAPDSLVTQTSFVTGMNAMPSHEEGSTDGLDISDFDLSAPPSQHGTNDGDLRTKQELEIEHSDTDEDDIGEIHFQSSHFNGDSSEEEEKDFVQGLSFDAAEADKTAGHPSKATVSGGLSDILTSTAVQAVARNIADITAMGQSLISTVIGTGAASVQEASAQTPRQQSNVSSVKPSDQCSSSSSDSDDFEMISQDDLS